MATSSNTSRVVVTDENTIPEAWRAKIPQAKPQTRRAALSAITDNVPKLQVAQKSLVPQKTYGNATRNFQQHAPSTFSKPSFSVYSDESEKDVQEEPQAEECILPRTVTQLYREEIDVPDFTVNIADSPMVLDLSCTERVEPILSNLIYQLHPFQRDVYAHMRNIEQKSRPKPTYMRKQPDINSSMRSVLVDWLIEVQDSYKMETATVHFAVSYLDRFLSCMSVLRTKLQLVGTTCLFIAAKYEEIYPPEIKEFVYVTDKTYETSQVRRMEQLILKVLSFNLSLPTPYDFLEYFSSMCSIPEDLKFLAEYICELSLLEDAPFLTFLPSIIAASSLCLANYIFGLDDPWSPKHIDFTGYEQNDLDLCVRSLWKSYTSIRSKSFNACSQKYSSTRYCGVSNLAHPGLVLVEEN